MKPIINLLLCLLLGFPMIGISQTSTKQSMWYGYTFAKPISPKWYNETEFMERHLINPFLQSQFLIRSRFHKSLSERMNYGAGGSLFLFYKEGSKSHTDFNLPELRPHGEFNFKANLASMDFENRFRGELRFFRNTNEAKTDLEDGYHFASARFRYRLQAVFPLATWSEKKSLKLKLADELMAMAGGTMGDLTFDQNRISADFSINFSPLLSLELGYVNWYQSVPTGGYLEQHIVRTVVKHQIKPSKK
jgi:hypothetical protein